MRHVLVLVTAAAAAAAIMAAPSSPSDGKQAAGTVGRAEARGDDRAERARTAREQLNVGRILRIRAGAWACQEAAGLPRRDAEHGRAALLVAGPRYRGWVADRWRTARSRCERVLRRTLPDVDDWLTAVRVVQRAYPGSEWWLVACSSSEGGHGAWVPNRQGSGAGGWMQFMHGTWEHDFNRAAEDLRARGFRVPPEAESWYSPLGQAIAAGWAYGHARPAGKWTGSTC